MNTPSDAGLSAAIQAFNSEAVLYCTGISDVMAQDYARSYATMLLNRAMGIECSFPRTPYGLFAPTRKLIESHLDRLRKKHLAETP